MIAPDADRFEHRQQRLCRQRRRGCRDAGRRRRREPRLELLDGGATVADDRRFGLLISLDKLLDGDLDPTMAYMTGKLKVEGRMGVALKINAMLSD